MPALAEYTNVYGTCIDIMQNKGWRCWFDPKINLYCAEKDGWDLMGETPAGLLGMVAIHETMAPAEWREYWWRSDDPVDPYVNLPTTKPDYTPIWDRTRRSPDSN